RLARVEERHESLGLAERREEPPLALEAGEALLVDSPQQLERDFAAVGRARVVDDPRAAAADLGQELVGADSHSLSVTQQEQQERLLRVQAILGLIPDRALRDP